MGRSRSNRCQIKEFRPRQTSYSLEIRSNVVRHVLFPSIGDGDHGTIGFESDLKPVYELIGNTSLLVIGGRKVVTRAEYFDAVLSSIY